MQIFKILIIGLIVSGCATTIRPPPIKEHSASLINSLAFSPNGKLVFSQTTNSVKLWEINSGATN